MICVESIGAEMSGAWYSWGKDRIGQGRDSARQLLKEHPEMCEQIRRQVLEKAGLLKKVEEPKGSAEKGQGSTEKGPAAPSGGEQAVQKQRKK